MNVFIYDRFCKIPYSISVVSTPPYINAQMLTAPLAEDK